ncbi:hypothetical protein CP532_2662 [Ophiocordyceps camponoti-leonardi (nom. inval.)]|nr:hypothetical protein CP532_2662 [Ophiocordyceps camponoti-leonardi (nom. inval.)]
MGSRDEELTVLVTGFGASNPPPPPPNPLSPSYSSHPFGDHQAVNPSWEIAKRLPAELPPTEEGGPRVRIIVYPEPIRVSYRTVRKLVPTLWDDDDDDDDEEKKEEEKKEEEKGGKKRRRHIDAAIHIGMAGPRAIYQLERRAHRSGYRNLDVDGALPEDDDEDTDDDDDDDDKKQDDETKDQKSKGPAELTTELNLEDTLARWRNLSDADMDLRLSDDAGRFLCEFIYYASLSELTARKRRRNVVFFHVPCHATERYVSQGRDLAVALVRALADGLVAEKTTWWGCGKHIATVMKDIPAEQRCSCEPKVEQDGGQFPPMGSKPAS